MRQLLTQNVSPEEHASRFHAGKACRHRDSGQNENPRQEARDPSGKTRLYRLHGTRDLQFELLIQRSLLPTSSHCTIGHLREPAKPALCLLAQ